MYGAIFKGRCLLDGGYTQQKKWIIIGYVFNGMPEKVLQMINTMTVQPNEVIAIILFNACAKIADPHAVKLGKTVLSQLPAAFFDNHILMSSATDMLMKFGEVNEAEKIFKKIKSKNAIVYGAMMQGHRNGSYRAIR
jgi:predicted Zn-dependent protease